MRPKFVVSVLASGSKGNASLISAGEANFLVDAGISCKRIRNSLKSYGLKIEDLDGILITHEHTDHISGLKTISKYYDVDIYANEQTWCNMSIRKEIRQECMRVLPRKMVIKDVVVESFDISHDAAHPVGYTFSYQGEKCTYITDQGIADEQMYEALSGCRTLVIEANHDLEMLRNSSYPRSVQNRIMGSKGHLSNVATGSILANLDILPEQVFLAHISAENNTGSLALKTVKEVLRKNKRSEKIEFFITKPNEVVTNLRSDEDELF